MAPLKGFSSGYSIVVIRDLPKVKRGVRFPLPAQNTEAYFSCESLNHPLSEALSAESDALAKETA
jgi:hypothetical protein